LKLPRPVLALVAVLALVCAAVEAADAYTLRSDEGKFVAEFSAEPKYKDYEEKAHDGQQYVRHEWMLDQGEKAWLVSYNDYRRGTISDAGLDKSFENAIRGTTQGVKGELRNTTKLDNAGIAGREALIFSTSYKLMLRQRIFFVGDRIYQILYVGPPGTETDGAVDAFLSSLKILR
jgi:hypothetical protein